VLYAPTSSDRRAYSPGSAFVAGGILKVSFPISHSPVQNDPVLYRVDRRHARSYVTCGERELRFGMQWSVSTRWA